MAYDVTSAIFNAPKPDSNAATQGWNLGERAGALSAQAGPAAFALDVIKAKHAQDQYQATMAVEQQKARAAGVQRVITEGMSAPEGSQARLAAMTMAEQLQKNPVLAQATGFDPAKFKTTSGVAEMIAAMGGGSSDMQLDSIDSEGKAVFKNPKNSASFLEGKQKAVAGAIGEIENLKRTENRIAEALKAAEGITGGLGGKIERGAMKLFDPNNPVLGEWQKVKSILTDTQFLYTAQTKGAISDREMGLFASAAANDDTASLPAIRVALADVLNRLQTSTRVATESVKKNYGEDLSTSSQSSASGIDVNAALKAAGI